MIKWPEIFYRKVMQTLFDDNESYQSYIINIFKGIRWGEPVIAATCLVTHVEYSYYYCHSN